MKRFLLLPLVLAATPAAALEVQVNDFHFGEVACHFQDSSLVWRGILEDTLARTAKCIAINDALSIHGRLLQVEIDVAMTGGVVPCNAAVCTNTGNPVVNGLTTVPEVTNVTFHY